MTTLVIRLTLIIITEHQTHLLTNVCLQVGLGNMRVIMGDVKANLDILPADLCANAIVASGWHRAVQPLSNLPIFSISSNLCGQATWRRISAYI